MIPSGVENEVVTPPAPGEILLRVIDDLIRADRPDHFHIPRTAHAGDIGAERLRDLHGERTDASGRTVDQYLLPGINVTLAPESLQRGEGRDGYGGRLLERHVTGLRDQR